MFARKPFLFALCLAACGCGTLSNLPDAQPFSVLAPDVTRRAYGGVRMDAQLGSGLLLGDIAPLPLLGAYLLAVDLPLSAVGDTLTLPYVLLRGESKRPPGPWYDVTPAYLADVETYLADVENLTKPPVSELPPIPKLTPPPRPWTGTESGQ